MPVVTAVPDRENLIMTVVAEFDSPVEKVWNVWEDPRKLEQWWGPPSWPATFPEYDFSEGGGARYYMTGPEGEKANGYWRFQVIESARRLEFLDGFADEEGNPNEEMPTLRMSMLLEERGEGTRMTTVTRFDSLEDLEQLVEMGMEEGMREAMNQIDALL